MSEIDFIIAGAQKSGTTWIHHVLNQLDSVVIPDQEAHLFDCGDILSHPDFQSVDRLGLLRRSSISVPSWALDNVSGAKKVGIDSSTLFHSMMNFRDLASREPDLRLVVILRDPVERSYSHYWHLVRTGRAKMPFEKELLYGRQDIIGRSIYADQVHKIKDAFGDRALFLCFEATMKDKRSAFQEICDHLSLSLDLQNVDLEIYANPGRYPRFLSGWLFASRVLPSWERTRYLSELDGGDKFKIKTLPFMLKIGISRIFGLGEHSSRPPIKPRTRRELDEYFKDANASLDAIVDLKTSSYWYKSLCERSAGAPP